MEFKVGDKVRLKYIFKNSISNDIYGKTLYVEKCEGDYLSLIDELNELAFRGEGLSYMFEYFGNNVNNEVYDLIRNNEIKTFQAVLEDGRIVNISCLN